MHLNAYGEPYVIHGNRRDRVKQLGNAVTPPVMRALHRGDQRLARMSGDISPIAPRGAGERLAP